ncbi:MAG: PIN domain-containing protein [Propionibacteriaceae bacterium]|jgi:predicted nucleic acid-binding protein|nr:PIN domain-containing protein [Propionibacteriaceae bacterium]
MTSLPLVFPERVRVVVADANVLFSRSLRDYLLIAAEQEVIEVHWSPQILKDLADKLVERRPGFTAAAAQRLVNAMTTAFPDALITPSKEDLTRVSKYALPDSDDCDVIASALTVEATIICTLNRKHFPEPVMDDLGLTAIGPDDLLVALIDDYPPQMVAAHRQAVAHFPGGTDHSTLAALHKAQAPRVAARFAAVLQLTTS